MAWLTSTSNTTHGTPSLHIAWQPRPTIYVYCRHAEHDSCPSVSTLPRFVLAGWAR